VRNSLPGRREELDTFKLGDAGKAAKAAVSFTLSLALNTALSIAWISPRLLFQSIRMVPTSVGVAYARISRPMWIDTLRHCVAGLALGALSGDPTLVGLTALYSVELDLDHIPYLIGLPVPARISHSLTFLSISTLACWAATRERRHAASLASSVILHLAIDGARVPLLFPLSESASQPTWLRWAFAASSVLLMTLTGPIGRAVAKLARKRSG